jgi:hypothetical protein
MSVCWTISFNLYLLGTELSILHATFLICSAGATVIGGGAWNRARRVLSNWKLDVNHTFGHVNHGYTL